MLRTILIVAACLLLATVVSAQHKIGDNTLILDPASLLELESTSQGFLPSRMTSVQRDAQTEWDEGHIIYNTTDNCLQIYNGTSWDCFAQGVIIDSSIYRYNGTLLADRTVTMDGRSLTFDGSGGVIVIDSAGNLGIGDPTPDAKLDVEGGTVRLSDYGTGMIKGSESYLLGVDSEGDVIEVSPAIDTFSLFGNELRISLKGDTLSYDSVSLVKYLDNTDDQILDSLGLTGTTLEIGIEGDTNGLQSVDLSSLQDGTGTDDQNITGSGLSGTTLTIGIEGGSSQDVNLSGLQDGTGTDDQEIDSLGLTGTTLELGIEGDANGLQSVDLSSLQDGTGTDDQNITGSGLSGTTLTIGIEGGSSQDVNLSGLQDGTGTDDQILDSLGLTGNTLEIGIEGDVNGLQTLDLTPILGSSENLYNTSDSLESARTVTMDGNDLTFDGFGTGDIIFESDGDVGIGTDAPGARLEVAGGSVIFDEYGQGTYKNVDTGEVKYILGVDTSGAVVELPTAQNTRWFYAPAVTIDATDTISNATIDLHQEYVDQFTGIAVDQRSPGAPAALPTYAEDDLYYYVTFYDDTVIDNISITSAGVLTYDIIDVPFDNYTIVNIIFLLK